MSTGKTRTPRHATHQMESGNRSNRKHVRCVQIERVRAAHPPGAHAVRDRSLHSGSLARHGGTIRGVLLLTPLRESKRASVGTGSYGCDVAGTVLGSIAIALDTPGSSSSRT